MTFNNLGYVRDNAEDIIKLVKIISLTASVIGAYYFASYLAMFDIPFPLDLTVLPAVLLAIGLVTVVATLIVLGYLMLAAWAQTDPFDIGYARLIHSRGNGVFVEQKRNAITSILAIFVVPFAICFTVLYVVPESFEAYELPVLIGTYILWFAVFGLIKGAERKELSRKGWLWYSTKVAVFTFFVAFFTLVAAVIYVAILAPRGMLNTVEQVAASFAVFIFINFGVLYPSLNVRAFRRENEAAFNSGERLNPTQFEKNVYKSPAGVVAGALLFATLFPPFSGFLGEWPVRLLGLSNLEGRVLYATEKDAAAWPPELVDECSDGRCRSKKLIVPLDLGKVVYVSLQKQKKPLYRIPRNGLIEKFGVSSTKSENDASAGEEHNKGMRPTPNSSTADS